MVSPGTLEGMTKIVGYVLVVGTITGIGHMVGYTLGGWFGGLPLMIIFAIYGHRYYVEQERWEQEHGEQG